VGAARGAMAPRTTRAGLDAYFASAIVASLLPPHTSILAHDARRLLAKGSKARRPREQAMAMRGALAISETPEDTPPHAAVRFSPTPLPGSSTTARREVRSISVSRS